MHMGSQADTSTAGCLAWLGEVTLSGLTLPASQFRQASGGVEVRDG